MRWGLLALSSWGRTARSSPVATSSWTPESRPPTFTANWLRSDTFGEDHLRHVLREYETHYNEERPHQALGNESLKCVESPDVNSTGEVICSERLSGLLNTTTEKQRELPPSSRRGASSAAIPAVDRP
jgi:transposase InsO family protein